LARSGSPLFMSIKPGVLTDAQMEDVRAAMAVNSVQQNEMMPMDWMENDTPGYWKIDGEIVEYDWFRKYGSGW
jgi:alpha-galactosidase